METRAWKKIKELEENGKCRSCMKHRETVHHLLPECKLQVETVCLKRHNSTLKALALKWAVENRLLPEEIELF